MSSSQPHANVDRPIQYARFLKRILDDSHLDPIIGFLFPVVGDIATGLLGFSLVVIAWRRRLPAVTLARMLLNLALDAGLGAIPIFGDVFDFYFRANTRNLALLEARTQKRRGSIVDGLVLIGAGLCFVAALVVPIFLIVKLVALLWTAQPQALPPR